MMHRFPAGVAGEKVHQKRVPNGAPPWLETVRVEFPRYGRHAYELCVTELASVLWAVQMSTVEFHPWNSRRADTERPDEWRIDLDPMPRLRVRHGAPGRPCRPRDTRRTGRDRVAEDVRRQRPARLRPDRAAVGLRRGPPGRAGLCPGGRAPRPGRRDDHLVAKGPRPDQAVRRLQPERQGPHDRQRLLGARRAGGDRLHADHLGRDRRRRPAGSSPSPPCPAGSPSSATCTRASTMPSTRWTPCSSGPTATASTERQTFANARLYDGPVGHDAREGMGAHSSKHLGGVRIIVTGGGTGGTPIRH